VYDSGFLDHTVLCGRVVERKDYKLLPDYFTPGRTAQDPVGYRRTGDILYHHQQITAGD
jgi:hypothetical protein